MMRHKTNWISNGVKLQRNVLLKNYTTFRIGGPTKYFFLAKTKKDLIKAILLAKKQNMPFFILGGGSNILVADSGFNGLVIEILNTKYKILNTEARAEAGAGLGKIVSATANAGLQGMEWATGIPGTVGGAIQGNAGAFGGSMRDITKTVTVLEIKNQKSKIKNFRNKDCKFGYRESIFKKNPNLIILSCELQLKKGDKKKIKEKIQENLNYRKEKHPKEPSAGSCFKNIDLKKLKPNFFKKFPEARKAVKENILPTAFLIDKCGLKGKKIGDAQISKVHPNFIVNLNGAKAKDVLKLIDLVKKKVKEKFGIKLEEEIELL